MHTDLVSMKYCQASVVGGDFATAKKDVEEFDGAAAKRKYMVGEFQDHAPTVSC